MYLIDSHIIIYSYSDQYKYLRSILVDHHSYVSEISRVEVLGYHKLLPEEESYFSDIFKLNSPICPSYLARMRDIKLYRQQTNYLPLSK